MVVPAHRNGCWIFIADLFGYLDIYLVISMDIYLLFYFNVDIVNYETNRCRTEEHTHYRPNEINYRFWNRLGRIFSEFFIFIYPIKLVS